MKIGIIGAGISGLGAALALSKTHDVHVFEQQNRPGGHANTANVEFADGVQPVDTGFIVYNFHNYPNLSALFEHLDVPTRWSNMSFGFSLNGGKMEYACDGLDKIFAQRWRAFDPRFLGGFREILRFTKIAPRDLNEGRLGGLTLDEWLDERRFSDWFRSRFLLPMGGAIWSTCVRDVLDFPAEHFVRFFCNHDLMTGLDPARRWRTVQGGSREYVNKLVAQLDRQVCLERRAVRIDQGASNPVVRFDDGSTETFDEVILAVHAPDARELLNGADPEQTALLANFRTSENVAILHSDPKLMPRRRRVWSSWNFLSKGAAEDFQRPAQVSYWMNRLQGIPANRELFVSLNPEFDPDPNLTHGSFIYAHPLFDSASFAAQAAMDSIQGRNGVWFAGAWLGYGFHEDGLRAGLRVATALGAQADWIRDTGTPFAGVAAHAAE